MDQFQHAAGCVDRIDSESYSAVVLYCERCGDLESALPKSRGRKPKKPRAPTKGAPKQLLAHNAPPREPAIPAQTVQQEPSIPLQTAQQESSVPRQTLQPIVAAPAGSRCAIFCRCRDDPAAGNPAIPLLTLRWTFPAKRASVVAWTASLAGLLLSPASAPWLPMAHATADRSNHPSRRGLRAVWNKSSGVVILRHSLALPAPPPFG